MKRRFTRSVRYLGYALLTLLVVLLVGVGVLYLHSPGTTAPIVDSAGQPVPGSIVLLESLELNGVK